MMITIDMMIMMMMTIYMMTMVITMIMIDDAGGVKHSHPLNTSETGDTCQLHGQSKS